MTKSISNQALVVFGNHFLFSEAVVNKMRLAEAVKAMYVVKDCLGLITASKLLYERSFKPLCARLEFIALTDGEKTAKDRGKVLLSRGEALLAEIDKRDNNGQTPLMKASTQDDPKEVEKWIEKGADVNAKDRWNRTSILLAACQKPENMTLLIIAKANVNVVDNEGMTPLMHVCYRWQENGAAIEHLLKAKANIWYEQAPGVSALRYLCEYTCDVNGLNAFLKHGAHFLMNARDPEGATLLHLAARSNKGNPDFLKTLISANANVNARDVNGRTALFDTIPQRNLQAATLLIQHKCDVNTRDKNGENALYFEGSFTIFRKPDLGMEMVQLLVKENTSVNVANDQGETCLMESVRTNKSAAFIQELLTAKADVNATNKSGQKVINYINAESGVTVMKILLNAEVGNIMFSEMQLHRFSKEQLVALCLHNQNKAQAMTAPPKQTSSS